MMPKEAAMTETRQQDATSPEPPAWLAAGIVVLVLGAAGAFVWWSWRGTAGQPIRTEVIVQRAAAQQASEQTSSTVKEPAAAPKPTPVTLKIEDSPEKILREIAKQAGVQLETSFGNDWARLKDQRITLALDRAPFWKAVDDVCRKADLGPSMSFSAQRNPVLTITADAQSRQPRVVEGAFLFLATQVTRTSLADLS